MFGKGGFLALTVASMLFVGSGAANAAGITIGPGGVTIHPDGPPPHEYDHHRHDYHPGISEDEAVSIARHYGVRHVDGVDRRHGNFEVYGTDRHHNDITVVIDSDNGDVVDVQHG